MCVPEWDDATKVYAAVRVAHIYGVQFMTIYRRESVGRA